MFKWIKSLFSSPKEVPEAPQEERVQGKLQITHFEAEGDNQVKIEVEYDEQFVSSLRSKGFTGTDEQVVSSYISTIYKSVEMQGNMYD